MIFGQDKSIVIYSCCYIIGEICTLRNYLKEDVRKIEKFKVNITNSFFKGLKSTYIL